MVLGFGTLGVLFLTCFIRQMLLGIAYLPLTLQCPWLACVPPESHSQGCLPIFLSSLALSLELYGGCLLDKQCLKSVVSRYLCWPKSLCCGRVCKQNSLVDTVMVHVKPSDMADENSLSNRSVDAWRSLTLHDFLFYYYYFPKIKYQFTWAYTKCK